MKKILLLILGAFIFLAPLSCTNQATTRKLNALSSEVNQLNSDINALNKRLDQLQTQLSNLDVTPHANLSEMDIRILELNEQYVRLGKELIEVQKKMGMQPMELLPPTYK